MIEVISPEWFQVWLQGKDVNNLVAISNTRTLKIGFVERDKSNGVMFRISDMRTHPRIHKLYLKLLKKQETNPLGPMQQNWVSYVIS
jgi:hypothetical protein